jgi:DinB superfamily
MDTETAMYFGALTGSLETILRCSDGLDSEALNWRPEGQNTNSLYALTVHTLSNAHRNVLSHYCGESYTYDRAAELREQGESAAALRERHEALVRRMEAALKGAGRQGLTRICDHQRLGKVPGRAVLLQVARHAAEHAGEANLTRALLDARR